MHGAEAGTTILQAATRSGVANFRVLNITGSNVSISGVTRWLSNGDTVEFDGASGIVRRTGGGEEKA